MAKLLQAGDFASDGETRAATELQKLPKHWVIISNKVIPASNGRSYEVDFIILADHWVFLLDEKSWTGKITGNDQEWTSTNGFSTRSPVSKSAYVGGILASHLKAKMRDLGTSDQFFVRGGVLLSAATTRPIIRDDPRAQSSIFLLNEVCRRHIELDAIGGNARVGAMRSSISDYLMGLLNRPKIPPKIGMFDIDELISERPGVRTFGASLEVGAARERRLLTVYDLSQGSEREEQRQFYYREFEALRTLASTKVVPEVDAPFPASDDSLALPIHPLKGTVLSACPIPGSRNDLVGELLLAAACFGALGVIHAAGVVHRAISPDAIYILSDSPTGKAPRVAIANFYAARVGTHSIAVHLDELTREDPYIAPELAAGYGNATFGSDTYSLALVFLERLTGCKAASLRSATGDVTLPAFDERWNTLSDDMVKDLRDVFDGILTHRHAEKRYTANEVATLLNELATAVRSLTVDERPMLLGENGRYRVIRTLGRGSTAITYLAEDTVTHELLALKKLLLPDSALQTAITEWTALKNLNSPCFPRIAHINGPEHDFQIEMEFISGTLLSQVASEFPWSLTQWRKFADAMLDIVGELERQRILHRDIKPENIILREVDSRPVLIDFGFATTPNTPTAAAGSSRYLPPEAITAATPPESSDTYALAVTLYYALTGAYPDQGHVAVATPVDASAYELGAIERVLPILRRAAAAKPADRLSLQELRAQLAIAWLAPPEPIALSPEPDPDDALAQPTLPAQAVASLPSEADMTSEKGAPPELTEQINPWVADIRSLYRNSAAGNANNRGLDTDFVRETYTPTALDTILLPMLLAQPPKALFLSGNPGDGKTAFLEQVKAKLLEMGATPVEDDLSGWELALHGHTYRSCYDASEANGGLSADDNLKGRLAGLEGASAPTAALTAMVAINDGRLYDFFERNQTTFGWLYHQVFSALRTPGAVSAVGAVGTPGAVGDVWVVDLKRRAFVRLPEETPTVEASAGQAAPPRDATPARSVALLALDALVAPERWGICEQCVAQDVCPIRQNAALLHQPIVGERLEYALLLTHLRRHKHITMRDLRSAYAYLITADLGCADVHAARNGADHGAALTARAYWQSAFAQSDDHAGQGADDLLAELARLDPARLAQPSLDRYLYFHQSERDSAERRRLFADGRDVSPHSFAETPKWRQAFKRRLYFEGSADASGAERPAGAPAVMWRRLLPYHYAEEFLRALAGQADPQETLRRLARGVLRSDGVNVELSGGSFGVVVKKSDEERLIILKEFPLRDFTLVASPKRNGQIVETIPEALILQARGYSASQPLPQKRTPAITATLTLDHFELLMRLADGLQPGAPEYGPLLEDLVPFKSALLLREANDLTLIEGQSRLHHITQRDGKIVLTQNVQGATR